MTDLNLSKWRLSSFTILGGPFNVFFNVLPL